MKRKTLLLLFTVLLAPLAARAQTNATTPTGGAIENDPQFKRLSAEQQQLVRQIMDQVESAANAERAAQTAQPSAQAQPKTVKPNTAAPKAQAGGCPADPPKKSRFHVPKALQDAINSGKLGDLTGVNLDPSLKKDTPKDATGKPCPPAPVPAKPASK
jgi:hypothetical protein